MGGLGGAYPKARAIGDAFWEHLGVRQAPMRAEVGAESAKMDAK